MAEPEANEIPVKAKQLLEDGLWEDAVEELDRALQVHPKQMALWREKANTLVALGRPKEALACYERMLEIDRRDPSIYREMGEVLESLDRDDEALECYRQGLTLAPSDVDLLRAMGPLLTRMERISEAISIYDRILALKPDDPEFLIAKGDTLISAGQIKEGAAYFEQVARTNANSFGAREWASRGDTLYYAQKNNKAIEFYDKAIQADGKYAWAYRGKALALRKIPEKSSEAVECFETAIKLDPNTAWYRLGKGNIHYDRKEYDLAAKSYAEAVEIDPKYGVAWGNLGMAQEALQQYDRALVSAEKSIELDPKSADAWVHKGLCLGYLEHDDESISSYRMALDLDPANYWANNNMGWEFLKQKRDEEALSFFEKAIEIDPKGDTPWLNKAECLVRLGRREDALATLDEGLKVISDKASVLAKKGYIYSEYLYQQDKALECYIKCRELEPTNVVISSDIAEVLIKMGRYAEGRAEAEKLMGSLPDLERECAMSIVILASYALEGDVSGRTRQFENVLEQFKAYCPGGKPKKKEREWSFAGLVNTILSSNISAESKFLVLTAIDVHQGKLIDSELSFFKPATLQTIESTANAVMSRQSAS